MKSCWNCNKTNLEDSDARCWNCLAAVAVVEPLPIEAKPAPPASRPRARGTYALRERPTASESARAELGYRIEQAGAAASVAHGFVRALQDNARSAAVLGVACCSVAAATLSPAGPPMPLFHWPTAIQADRDGMYLRAVEAKPRQLATSGGTVTILDAWAAHVGQHRYRSMFASDTVVGPSGRQAVYFATKPGAPAFTTGNPPRPVAKVRVDDPPCELHWVEVEWNAAPTITCAAGGATLTLR